MRSSILFQAIAILATLAAGASPAAQKDQVATGAKSVGAHTSATPKSGNLAAQRAAELVQALQAANEGSMRSFAATGWRRGKDETVDDALGQLRRLSFYLGERPTIRAIDTNPDGSAAVHVVNVYGRESTVNLEIEERAPHRVWVTGLDRTPLSVPKDLLEPRSAHLATPLVSAPLTFIGGRPMVDVMIGDKGPFRFMVETGANHVSISPEVAAAVLNDLTPLTPDLMWQVGEQKLGSTYLLKNLRIAEATLNHLGVMVVPKRPGEDGMLGLPAYRNLLLGLNLTRKTMTLQKGSLASPDGEEILPLRPLGPLVAVDVGVGEKVVPFEIDTQADGSLFLATELAGDWKFDQDLVRVGTVVTAGGQHRAASMLGRLSGDLKLGKYIFQKPLITVRADPDDTIPPSGLLGVGALKHFHMVLDQKNGRVRFTRAGSPVIAPPPSYRALGFNIFAGRDGKPKIVDLVTDGTAAKAGLKPGDVVVKLGPLSGKEAAGNVTSLAQTSQPIVIEVLRDGKPLKMTVRSAVLVK